MLDVTNSLILVFLGFLVMVVVLFVVALLTYMLKCTIDNIFLRIKHLILYLYNQYKK